MSHLRRLAKGRKIPERIAAMITKEDFLNRHKAAKQDEKKAGAIAFLVIGGFLIANIPFAKWIDNHKPANWIQIVYAFMIITFLVAACVYMIFNATRRVQKFHLGCPRCKRSLMGMTSWMVTNNGKCPYCETTVFDC